MHSLSELIKSYDVAFLSLNLKSISSVWSLDSYIVICRPRNDVSLLRIFLIFLVNENIYIIYIIFSNSSEVTYLVVLEVSLCSNTHFIIYILSRHYILRMLNECTENETTLSLIWILHFLIFIFNNIFKFIIVEYIFNIELTCRFIDVSNISSLSPYILISSSPSD